MTPRRSLLALPALPALPPSLAFSKAPWPQKPVRLTLPYAAGDGTDILARAKAEALRSSPAHPIIVENRAGAAGVIGSEPDLRSSAETLPAMQREDRIWAAAYAAGHIQRQ
jgi:tripartite-type tricarboxylate transporter receptor subunit TctC